MPAVTFVAPNGERRTIDIPVGWSVMEGAIQNDIDGIVAECGGGCACATCHVYVDNEWCERVGKPSGMESDMLECTAATANESSRLSCQIKITETHDGLVLHLPETQI